MQAERVPPAGEREKRAVRQQKTLFQAVQSAEIPERKRQAVNGAGNE